MDHGVAPLPKLVRIGIPDQFPAGYGSQDSMMESFGLQPEQIAQRIRETACGQNIYKSCL
jgi:transketolase C-terminal domain/subunit